MASPTNDPVLDEPEQEEEEEAGEETWADAQQEPDGPIVAQGELSNKKKEKKPGKQRARKEELKRRRAERGNEIANDDDDDAVLTPEGTAEGTETRDGFVTREKIEERNREVETLDDGDDDPEDEDGETGTADVPTDGPFPTLPVYTWETCWEMGLEAAPYATNNQENPGIFDFVLRVLGLVASTTDASVSAEKKAKDVDAKTKSAKKRRRDREADLGRPLTEDERESLDDGSPAPDSPVIEETEAQKRNPLREVPKGTAPRVTKPLAKLRGMAQAARMDIRRCFEDPGGKGNFRNVCFFKVDEGLNILDPMMLERQTVKMPHYTVFDVLGYLMAVAASGWETKTKQADNYHLALLSLYCHWTRKVSWTLLGSHVPGLQFNSLVTDTIPAMHSSMWTASGHLVLGSSIPGGPGMKKQAPPKSGGTGGERPDDGPGKPSKGKNKSEAPDKTPKVKPRTNGDTIGTGVAGPSNTDQGAPPIDRVRRTKKSTSGADQELGDEGQAPKKKKKAKSVGQTQGAEEDDSQVISAKTKVKRAKGEEEAGEGLTEARPKKKSTKVNGTDVGVGVDEELAETKRKKKKSLRPVDGDGLDTLPERPEKKKPRNPDAPGVQDAEEPGVPTPKKTKKKAASVGIEQEEPMPKKATRRARDGATDGLARPRGRRNQAADDDAADDAAPARERSARARSAKGDKSTKQPKQNAENDVPGEPTPKREVKPTFGKKDTSVKDDIQEDRATKILSVGPVKGKGKTLDLSSATAYPTKQAASGEIERATAQLFGHCAESNEFVWLAKGSEWSSGVVHGLAMNPRALALSEYVPGAYMAELRDPCPNCTELLMQIVGNQEGKKDRSAQQTVLRHFGVGAFRDRLVGNSLKDKGRAQVSGTI